MRVSPHRAFTLIEASAILVLIGLMASAGALSLRSAYRGSELKDVVSRIRSIDRSARSAVQLNGRPGVIQIDERTNTIRFTHDGGERAGLMPVVLPSGFDIKRVAVASVSAAHGAIQIPCSAHGQTPTYLISISGPGDESTVLVFSGLTGLVTELDEDSSFELDELLSTRHDAD